MSIDYNFSEIERKWQKYWEENRTFQVSEDTAKPKFYVLDMFPYPSGAGLHVGHPLGYIASDIYSRYKRLACRRSSMPYRPAAIRPGPPRKTSPGTSSS